jgi:hypothetical protein
VDHRIYCRDEEQLGYVAILYKAEDETSCDAPTVVTDRGEMSSSVGPYHVPMLPVLRGAIESMFVTYEEILPAIYFHKSQVSFSSDPHKQTWLKHAASVQNAQALHQDSEWVGRAIDLGQMESADSYTSFLTKASQSQTTVWTALFLTYDECWHYWGAVLSYSAVERHVDIYIRPLEDLPGSPEQSQPSRERLLPSQRRLGAACRAQHWSTKMHVKGKQCADIDTAFRWINIWEGST